ncbi:hypothetical protein HanIR_Chr15g0758401 [Helianthus annuus]|nr:hypothetical protein HanIR_Chr15g0758401 [Helianthus annuus]
MLHPKSGKRKRGKVRVYSQWLRCDSCKIKRYEKDLGTWNSVGVILKQEFGMR